MPRSSRHSAKPPRTPDRLRPPNESLSTICLLMIGFAGVATPLAWVMDRPGAICWALRLGGPLVLLLAIGLLWKFRDRSVTAPGDPRGKLKKHGTVAIVAQPILANMASANEPGPPAVPTWPQRVVGCGVIGVFVLVVALMTVFAVYSIVEGIRQMVTQTAVTHNRHDPTPIPLTGAMAVLNGAVMATLGSLFLLPSLFLFRALWKKYCSKQSNRLDERNS